MGERSDRLWGSLGLTRTRVIAAASALIGVQVMFSAFCAFGKAPKDSAVLATLTDAGALIYQPERELPIYALACVVSTVFALVLYHVFGDRTDRRPSTGSAHHDPRHFYRALRWGTITILATFVMFVFALRVWSVETLTAIPPLLLVFAMVELVCLIVWLRSGPKFENRAPFATAANAVTALSNGNAQFTVRDTTLRFSPWELLVPLCLILLLYIPDPARLIGRVYDFDGLHHWDYFAMAPAVGYLHGAALTTQVYSQYGVAWPVIFALLAPVFALSYAHMLQVFVIVTCLYFWVIYRFLRNVVGSLPWAAAGVAVALYLQLFCGDGGVSLWYHPSSTIIRSMFDVPVLFALWRYLQAQRSVWFYGAACLTGLALLFETDTGIYVALTLILCWCTTTLAQYHHAGARAALSRFEVLILAGGLIGAIVVLGLMITSRGAVFQPGFGREWLEAITLYPSGMSMLAIFDGQGLNFTLAPFVIATYLLAAGNGAIRSWNGSATPRSTVLLLIGFYGLCALCQFIGRSSPQNIFHGIVPFVLIWTVILHGIVAREDQMAKAPRRYWAWGLVCGAATVGPYGMTSSVLDYPGIAHDLLAREQYRDYRPMIAETGDIALPGRFAQEIADFQSSVQEVRVVRARGNRVAILATTDTATYLASDTPLWSRYSPALLTLVKAQAAEMVERLHAGDPDYVFIQIRFSPDLFYHPTSPETLRIMRQAVRLRYVFVHRNGIYDVWRRKATAPPGPAAANA